MVVLIAFSRMSFSKLYNVFSLGVSRLGGGFPLVEFPMFYFLGGATRTLFRLAAEGMVQGWWIENSTFDGWNGMVLAIERSRGWIAAACLLT
jgi:hypothetical protein